MKIKLFLIGAITVQYLVSWDYKFSTNPSLGWSEYRLSKSFDEPQKAKEFIKHKPKETIFECIDQRTGVNGYCLVSDFKVFTEDK